MIFGTHFILYSRNAEADRAFLRDTLQFASVDAGHGWLIFALPPGELAVHPTADQEKTELYLLSNGLRADIAKLKENNATCSEIQEARWGSTVKLTLPSGTSIGLYEPKHALAIADVPRK